MHHELRDVTEFDDDLQTLVADMVATMYAAEGVGLAANQVGTRRGLARRARSRTGWRAPWNGAVIPVPRSRSTRPGRGVNKVL